MIRSLLFLIWYGQDDNHKFIQMKIKYLDEKVPTEIL